MKKRIEKYFPAAMNAIADILQKEGKDIPREYQAYAAAFGSAVLQMGLLPTLAVYADKESGSAEDKNALLKVLAKTVCAAGTLNQSLSAKLVKEEYDLYKVAVFNRDQERALREHLLDAVVAVKLCLRTFKLSK